MRAVVLGPLIPAIAQASVDWPGEPANFTTLQDCSWANYNTLQGSLTCGFVNNYGGGLMISDPTAPFSPPYVLDQRLVPGGNTMGSVMYYFDATRFKNVLYVGYWFKRNYNTNTNLANKMFYVKGPAMNTEVMWDGDGTGGPGGRLIYDLQNPSITNCHLGGDIVTFHNQLAIDGYCGLIPALLGAQALPINQWTRIEFLVKFSATGVSRDGVLMAWLTPFGGTRTQVMNYLNVNNPGPVDEIQLTTTITNTPGNTVNWDQMHDHFYISTGSDIGPLSGDTTPPARVQGLQLGP